MIEGKEAVVRFRRRRGQFADNLLCHTKFSYQRFANEVSNLSSSVVRWRKQEIGEEERGAGCSFPCRDCIMWIPLCQYRGQWLALIKSAMNAPSKYMNNSNCSIKPAVGRAQTSTLATVLPFPSLFLMRNAHGVMLASIPLPFVTLKRWKCGSVR